AVADIRNDPPALFLFWAGAGLVLWRRAPTRVAALRVGVGIALVAFSAMWNPKWPLTSLVLGVVSLIAVVQLARRSLRLALWAIIPAAAAMTACFVFLLRLASFRDYLFFTFQFNWEVVKLFKASPVTIHSFQNLPRFAFCAEAFRGVWPLAALSVVSAA